MPYFGINSFPIVARNLDYSIWTLDTPTSARPTVVNLEDSAVYSDPSSEYSPYYINETIKLYRGCLIFVYQLQHFCILLHFRQCSYSKSHSNFQGKVRHSQYVTTF